MTDAPFRLVGERVEVREPAFRLLASQQFVRGFTPPDYLVDGILQRRFCYSCTGQTGAGKTALALLLAAHHDRGWPLAGRNIERGRTLYFSGENSDDVRMRWICMAEQLDFDTAEADVHFIPDALSIPGIKDRADQEAKHLGGFSLVIVDTSAAYFEGKDENDNKQMGAHARMLRGLTTLHGGPTVLALTHPVKNAGPDNLLPRGGGAFLCEMDGNLTCSRDDTLVRLHWQGKHRGPDFEPLSFELRTIFPASLRDSKGRPIPTIVAAAIEPQDEAQREVAARSDEETLLCAMRDSPRATIAALLAETGWQYKSRVSRVMQRLEADKLARKRRGRWQLTEAGKQEVKDAETPV